MTQNCGFGDPVLLADLSKSSVRVVFAAAYNNDLNKLGVFAWRRGLVRRGWAWIACDGIMGIVGEFADVDGVRTIEESRHMINGWLALVPKSAQQQDQAFLAAVRQRSMASPFNVTFAASEAVEPDYVAYLYDAIMLYGATMAALSSAHPASSKPLGFEIAEKMKTIRLPARVDDNNNPAARSGPVKLDENGDNSLVSTEILNFVHQSFTEIVVVIVAQWDAETNRTTWGDAIVYPGNETRVPLAVVDACHPVYDDEPKGPMCTEALDLKAVWIPCIVIACIFCGLVCKYRVAAKRYVAEQKRRQERLEASRLLQETLLELAEKKGTETGIVPSEVDPTTGEMIFVFTDIMNSTDAAAHNPTCMHGVQRMHDVIMRESISRYSGFEIGTQGDAFECAFVSVVDAVNFALDVQTKLHVAAWNKDVLSLPGWGVVRNVAGDVMLCGPRIRIGIHRALCGEWVRYTHKLTRQHIFHGPGYDIAATISDAAHGGQVLLTRAALDALLPRMRAARFPVVQAVGVYTWKGLIKPLELFSVQPIPSPQLPLRIFTEPLRKIQKLRSGDGLAIVRPPQLRERTAQGEPGFTWVDGPTSFSPISFVAFEISDCRELLADASLASLVIDLLAICAAQTGGYISTLDGPVAGVVVFDNIGAAACFAAAAQVAFLTADWPSTVLSACVNERGLDGRYVFRGLRIAMAIHSNTDWTMVESDDRPHDDSSGGTGTLGSPGSNQPDDRASHSLRRSLFLKPRRLPTLREFRSPHTPAEAHSPTSVKSESLSSLTGAFGSLRSWQKKVSISVTDLLGLGSSITQTYSGAAVLHAEMLAKCAWGGQIILTQAAWDEMGDSLPSGTHVLSLGTHIVNGSAPMVLMELVPNGLRTRSFPSISERPAAVSRVSHTVGRPLEHGQSSRAQQQEAPARPLVQQLAPGFRDSPDPKLEMAIVFVATKLPSAAESVIQPAVELYGDRLRALRMCMMGTSARSRNRANSLSHSARLRAPCASPLPFTCSCSMPRGGKSSSAFQGAKWSTTARASSSSADCVPE